MVADFDMIFVWGWFPTITLCLPLLLSFPNCAFLVSSFGLPSPTSDDARARVCVCVCACACAHVHTRVHAKLLWSCPVLPPAPSLQTQTQAQPLPLTRFSYREHLWEGDPPSPSTSLSPIKCRPENQTQWIFPRLGGGWILSVPPKNLPSGFGADAPNDSSSWPPTCPHPP